MNRFFMYTMYQIPLLKKFDYYLRIDTDLWIDGKFPYDPFQKMHALQKTFGFVRDGPDDETCNRDMKKNTIEWMKKKGLKDYIYFFIG